MFDSVSVLERLESIWDELLIPPNLKIKLYEKYSTKKYIDNLNTIRDAYRTWNQGAFAICARETLLMELSEFERSLSAAAKRPPILSERIQEQKTRSALFKRLSHASSGCEKIIRKLWKDHQDHFFFQTEIPYIEKMQSDYLGIVAGIDQLANREIDYEKIHSQELEKAEKLKQIKMKQQPIQVSSASQEIPTTSPVITPRQVAPVKVSIDIASNLTYLQLLESCTWSSQK